MKIIVKTLSKLEINKKNIYNWPIWKCDISEFDWEYTEQESCLLLKGDVEVISNTETVKFKAGDFVVFPKGLQCKWKVYKPVEKHYLFG